MTLQQPLTFRVSTGKAYSLEQLFKPGSDYVAKLSGIVKKQIEERKIETLEPFESIRPDQSFYIADRSLVIYFNLYELAAYVYGFIYFPISVYEIQDIIDEQGPLGAMLVND
ncbi:RsiV family protein [Paenibacillus protaetiae]|uniref:RsiV family protein n=1 Tax=Paenibacillus protaetiae TaxID=2509456 RepID=UPI001FC92D99|nr:RsiV family protein [Paenibacillus protaetiae]